MLLIYVLVVLSSPVSHPFSLEEMGKHLPTLTEMHAFDMRQAIREARQKYALKFMQLGKDQPPLQVCFRKCQCCVIIPIIFEKNLRIFSGNLSKNCKKIMALEGIFRQWSL